MMGDLRTDLQTIIQSWQAIARREQEKLSIPGRLDPYPEYRAGYAYGLEVAADDLAEVLAEAIRVNYTHPSG